MSAPAKIQVTLASDAGVIESFDTLQDGGLSFGSVPVLIPVQQTLTVTNLGAGSLTITGISIISDGGVFSVVGTPPTSIGGTGSSPLILQFDAPQQDTYSATLVITSDDTSDKTVSIPLAGTGSTEGKLDAEPNPLDFGNVGQGQTQPERLTLNSVGTAPLLITGSGFGPNTDPAFTQANPQNPDAGPSTLDAGDSIGLVFLFSPTANTPAVATGTFLIQSSDPTQQPAIVQLTGARILAPIAVITAPQTVAQGDTVVVDGGGSYDPNQPPLYPLTYVWGLYGKPVESTLSLDPAALTEQALSATLDAVGNYTFQLQVTNDAGIPSAYTFATVYARPTDDLYVEMIWDNDPIDMDLHLIIDGGVLDGTGDCNAYDPDAGFSCTPGSDHLIGPGPEWIGIAIPPDADYSVDCKLTDAKNATDVATIVTLRVYVYGVLASQVCQQLTFVSDVWSAVTIAWPSGIVTPIGSTIACPENN